MEYYSNYGLFALYSKVEYNLLTAYIQRKCFQISRSTISMILFISKDVKKVNSFLENSRLYYQNILLRSSIRENPLLKICYGFTQSQFTQTLVSTNIFCINKVNKLENVLVTHMTTRKNIIYMIVSMGNG